MGYAELGVRSCFSLLEGASQPDALVDAAVAQGVSHLGVVDRDAVYGLPKVHIAAKKFGLAVVCGASLTIDGLPPVMLHAADARGWANLCKLITASRAERAKGWAMIRADRLLERAAGLYATLPFGWSVEHARPLRDAFGDRLSVALTRQWSPTDRARDGWARSLATALDAPLLATHEPLYAVPSDRELADVLACVRRRTTLRAAGTWLHANAARHLLSEAAFCSLYGDAPAAIARGLAVAQACTFTLAELRYRYPPEVVPDGHTAMSWLRALTWQGAARRWPSGMTERVQHQLEHELAVVEQLDFSAYFLTVYDAVAFARQRGILCQGRGSAANSAVCFALGITSVDPARASLLFERFISVERNEPPDIDVDFEHERREEVIQYLYHRYGRHRAAMVNEVITWRRRSAVRDVGKVLGMALDQVDRLARATDRWSAGKEALPDDLVREAGVDPRAPEVAATMALADRMVGLPRHIGIHVGGFVIASGDLTELVPVEPATMDDRTVIQWEKRDVEALGFVKVDVLALGMLTAIRRSLDLVRDHYGLDYDLATIPAEDPAVYDMCCAADTVGVFQIESRAQQSMLPRLKPRCFYDLVVEVAIVRPGPIQGGMVHPYLRRRAGVDPVQYAHPALEPILARTLGVPIFQEQVMAMAVAVGGFTPGEADQLRRAMGAWRKRGGLDAFGAKLVRGMADAGIERAYAESIFAQIQGFGEYGFPESHAASFALLIYASAWIKCHHPDAFVAALVNSQPMGFYAPRALLADAQRHGVEVRPVCAVASAWDCTLEPRGRGQRCAVRLGLRLVSGLGQAEGEALVAARAGGPFTSLADIAVRAGLGRAALERLADADAFAALVEDRRRAAWDIHGLWTDLPLLAGLVRDEPAADLPAATPTEALLADYRSVGLSIDLHPLGLLRPQLDALDVRTLAAVALLRAGQHVRLAGLVQSRQRPGTAKGVVFITLEDETGTANLIIWPAIWAKYRRVARGATTIGVTGRVQRQGDAISVLVHEVWAVPGLAQPHADGEVEVLNVASRDFH